MSGSNRGRESGAALPLAILALCLTAMHYFCDLYVDMTIGGCCPQTADPLAVSYFSPTAALCWQWSTPLTFLMIVAVGGLLAASMIAKTRELSGSSFAGTTARILRVFGRITALFALLLLTLVLFSFTRFEFWI